MALSIESVARGREHRFGDSVIAPKMLLLHRWHILTKMARGFAGQHLYAESDLMTQAAAETGSDEKMLSRVDFETLHRGNVVLCSNDMPASRDDKRDEFVGVHLDERLIVEDKVDVHSSRPLILTGEGFERAVPMLSKDRDRSVTRILSCAGKRGKYHCKGNGQSTHGSYRTCVGGRGKSTFVEAS